MKRIQDVLPKAIEHEEALRMARAQAAMRHWDSIVGPELAARSHPDRYTKGTVWVAVRSSAWAQELRMMRDRILQRLRAQSGDPALFKDIRFGVRPLPERVVEIAPQKPVINEEGLTGSEIVERRRRRRAQGG